MEKRVIPSEGILVPGKVFLCVRVLGACAVCAVLCVEYHHGGVVAI